MALTKSKRASIAGLPIGKKQTTPDWVGIGRLAVSLGSGAFAAVRARNRLKEPAEKGKEAIEKASKLGDVASKVSDAVSNAGNPVTKAFGAVKALSGGGGGENGKDGNEAGGHDKRLKTYIEEHIDIGVPRREAYNQWTQFAQFSEIFKGVVGVEQDEGEDDKTHWQVKIGPSSRQWKAQITEQIPDKRIAWKSTEGVQVSGVVTFHELDANLTRVMVQMLYRPRGVVENVGNWMRLARRRTRKDLKLFKNYIEVRGEASGEWRGRIKEEQGRGEEALQPMSDERSAGSDEESRNETRKDNGTNKGSRNGRSSSAAGNGRSSSRRTAASTGSGSSR